MRGFLFIVKYKPMEESVFKSSFSAVVNGEYGENDVKVIKEWLESLNKKELTIKRKIEKNKNEFVKQKDRSNSELKKVRSCIKEIKTVLKYV